jgi:ABC-type bacteriocin/lantibiotic exporter with double-glycine peptidase domain
VKEGVGGGGEWAVYGKLKSLGVRFRMQWRGNYSHNLIKFAMKKNLGCVFAIEGFDKIKGERWAHAMVLVDFNDKEVMFIDPNDTDKVQTRPRSWFDQKWTGYVIVIEPPKNKVVVTTPP